MSEQPPAPQVSPDGKFYWDGTRWVPLQAQAPSRLFDSEPASPLWRYSPWRPYWPWDPDRRPSALLLLLNVIPATAIILVALWLIVRAVLGI